MATENGHWDWDVAVDMVKAVVFNVVYEHADEKVKFTPLRGRAHGKPAGVEDQLVPDR